MGATRRYFKNQFRSNKFLLEHGNVSDFYNCSWSKNRSALIQMCVNIILFLACLAIILVSLILTTRSIPFGYWFIYLTHWGLVLITVTTGFALAVSVRAYFWGDIDADFGLPWYVKAYWTMYNITMPVAFLITAFYWSILNGGEFLQDADGTGINPVLDILIHGVNSIVMFILLLSSRQPSYLLHVYQPLVLGLIYLAFSIIYYFAGGNDPFGNDWIYPVLDWGSPGPAVILAVVTALALIIIHLLIVGISLFRDFVTKQCRRDFESLAVSNENS